MARKLAARNIASIRLDYKGKGNSYGHCKHFDYSTALEDVNTVFKYVKDKYRADDFRIYAKGGGGYIGGVVAFKNASIKKVLLYEPY